ncbi:MAG: hypothetical protein HUJ77_02055 [Clostridium sp.]|uniref:hypothetical protein n=1 Tax=Clostridium sp. TaxID=1506 RepID=UPI0025BEE226|nr:hypothetical protein [Clostridium sp.]MCF0147161.1 hypothetical protein [Clostridium sp.]
MSNSNNNVKKRIEKRKKNKKQIKILMVILVVIVSVLACGIAIANNKENKVENTVKDLPLKVDSTPITFNIVEENKTKVLKATFKNESEETINRITLILKLKDTGETIEMKYNEAVAAGGTSNAFSGKAPKSGKLEDVEILKYKISLASGIYMEYDVELRQYNWS